MPLYLLLFGLSAACGVAPSGVIGMEEEHGKGIVMEGAF